LEGILDAQEVMPQHFLYRIGDQIRNLIHCSNLAPTKQLRSSGVVVLESSVDTNPEECYAQSNPSKTISRELPSSLKTLELSKVTTIEPAAIEHCLSLQHHQGIPLSECSLKVSAESLGLNLEGKQQLMPSSISLSELTQLSPVLVSRAMVNVQKARTSLMTASVALLGGSFLPDKNELLVKWLSDGARYSAGERLPAVNYLKHPDNNQRFLTDEAVHCIRHIVFCFKIPITKFPGLWNSFSVLFLRRPLSSDEFSSDAILPFRLSSARGHGTES
jgi:hypothetical protein